MVGLSDGAYLLPEDGPTLLGLLPTAPLGGVTPQDALRIPGRAALGG